MRQAEDEVVTVSLSGMTVPATVRVAGQAASGWMAAEFMRRQA